MDKAIPGTHIYWVEYRCLCCGSLPPDFYLDKKTKEISALYQVLFDCFEQIRQAQNEPILITRGYSCTKHHLYLYLERLRRTYTYLTKEKILAIIKNKGLTPYSTHIFGLALDLLPQPKDISRIVEIAKEIEPKLRIGYKGYRDNKYPHVHIDLGYKMYPRFSKHLRENATW